MEFDVLRELRLVLIMKGSKGLDSEAGAVLKILCWKEEGLVELTVSSQEVRKFFFLLL